MSGLRRHSEAEAFRLAAQMPRLMLEARRSAATVLHGLHGRRQAGTGDQFWQFRPFAPGEPAARIDWRRSARDQRLSVKEREWEAAHTLFLHADISPSMAYRSELAGEAKDARALVMLLALAEIFVAGGERVGVLDVLPPSSSRTIIQDIAERLTSLVPPALPQAGPLPRRAECIFLTDGLTPLDALEATLARLAARGAAGALVLVNDPAEETFPFSGRLDFLAPAEAGRYRAANAGDLKEAYRHRLEVRRQALRATCNRLGWLLVQHRTDQPLPPALLMLHQRVSEAVALRGLG